VDLNVEMQCFLPKDSSRRYGEDSRDSSTIQPQLGDVLIHLIEWKWKPPSMGGHDLVDDRLRPLLGCSLLIQRQLIPSIYAAGEIDNPATRCEIVEALILVRIVPIEIQFFLEHGNPPLLLVLREGDVVLLSLAP
jgi:hypothetical protein